MDPNAQPPTQTQVSPPEGSKSNALLALISVFILLGVVGITLFLYLQNKSGNIKLSMGGDKKEGNGLPTPSPTPLTESDIEVNERIEKYHGSCKNFTSIEDALLTPEIACTLDLSGQDLSSLPSTISKLNNLSELNLSDNNFTEFPEELFELKMLTSVDLRNNKLTTIPELGSFEFLQRLILTGNTMEEKAQPTPKPTSNGSRSPQLVIIY